VRYKLYLKRGTGAGWSPGESAVMAVANGPQERLLEAFIVSAATEVGERLTPVMMFCLAPESAQLNFYKPVPDFSFPDPQQLKPGLKSPNSPKANDRETFVFTLTDKDSNRLYGFCRRYSATAGVNSVEVACILTRFCWYDAFSHLLDAVEDTATGAKGAYGVAALMKAVTAAGLPHPGQLLHIPVAGIHPSSHTLSIERPVNTSRCKYDRRLCVLFRSLVVSKIVMLFFLMLTERRIIIMSAHPSVLSDCAHALESLLYPFAWQHIYVPILVPKMIDYVCAPMPFLIGMHISMLPQLKQQPMEEVVMVDLDRGRLRYNEKDIQHLPDEHFDSMVNALQAQILESQCPGIFAGWRRYMADF
jgi:DENN domain-containing protein 2